MNEVKLGPELVAQEIANICDEFDISITTEQRAQIEPAIAQGRLYLSGQEIVYILSRPTENIKELRFTEPTGSQSERAGKGVKAIKTDKGTEIDIGEASKMTTNLVSAITGQPVGFINQIKNRDLKNIEAVANFFS